MPTTSPIAYAPTPSDGSLGISITLCPYSRLTVAIDLLTPDVVPTDENGSSSCFQPREGA